MLYNISLFYILFLVAVGSYESKVDVELALGELSDQKSAKRLKKLEKKVTKIQSDMAVVKADVAIIKDDLAAVKAASEATTPAVKEIQQTLQNILQSVDDFEIIICEFKNLVRPIERVEMNPDFVMCKYLCTI